jgi:hypothetical protein
MLINEQQKNFIKKKGNNENTMNTKNMKKMERKKS